MEKIEIKFNDKETSYQTTVFDITENIIALLTVAIDLTKKNETNKEIFLKQADLVWERVTDNEK